MAKINLKLKISRKELVILLIILGIAAFLRLFRISEYLTFLGDEGRDVIVVRRLLLYADPILVGPGTSIGNMYLGPLYYYFMAPWLFLFNYSPVGPAVGVAILGVITVWLVYYVGKIWFGKTAAIISSLLFAISPVVIIYSHSSWNPNIMPFFALLCILSIWKFWYEKKYPWLLVWGVSFAFVMQSHYLGLLLAPIFIIFWIWAFLESKKDKNTKKLILNTLYSGGIFALLMSPLVIFDARHGWRNLDSIKKFFLERQTTVSAKPWNAIPNLFPLSSKIMTRLVAAKNDIVGKAVVLALLIPILWVVKKRKTFFQQKEGRAFLLLFVWLGISFLGLGLYKQEIYDHYYGFFFAAPFLILGGIGQKIFDTSKIRGASIVIVGVTLLVIVNLLDNPFRYAPNRQLTRTQEVANEVIKLSGGQEFNLAVIAERNYDDAYQYFLDVAGAPLKDIDPQKTDETITDQLFVICEMPKEKCDPTHNPKAEVANFGWSKIEESWEVWGVNIFKLVHTQ